MRRNNGKRRKGRFLGIPYAVASSDAFSSLNAYEVKLLIDLLFQYTGSNNGMLSPCFSLMKDRQWTSGTLYRTKKTLIEKGFIVVTKQGMKIRGRPTLIAITWNGIDEPKTTYDEGIKASAVPLNYWAKSKESWAK